MLRFLFWKCMQISAYLIRRSPAPLPNPTPAQSHLNSLYLPTVFCSGAYCVRIQFPIQLNLTSTFDWKQSDLLGEYIFFILTVQLKLILLQFVFLNEDLEVIYVSTILKITIYLFFLRCTHLCYQALKTSCSSYTGTETTWNKRVFYKVIYSGTCSFYLFIFHIQNPLHFCYLLRLFIC